MARFHLNPTQGPKPCTAAEGACPFGSDAPHFGTQEEAQSAYEAQLLAEHSAFFSASRSERQASELSRLERNLEHMAPSELSESIHESEEHYTLYRRILHDRSDAAFVKGSTIDFLRTHRGPGAISEAALRANERMLASTRDRNRELMDELDDSPYAPRHTILFGDNMDFLNRAGRVAASQIGSRSFDSTTFTGPEAAELLAGMAPESGEPRHAAWSRELTYSTYSLTDIQSTYPELSVRKAFGYYQRFDRPWQVSKVWATATDAQGRTALIMPVNVGRVGSWPTALPEHSRVEALYAADTIGADYALISAYYDTHHIQDYTVELSAPVGPDRLPIAEHTAAWETQGMVQQIKGWKQSA
jgi:hypothetical protein